MPKSTASPIAAALSVLLLLVCSATQAQQPRWFRVELLVFSNDALLPPEGGASPEQWDPTPDLAYPGASRFLIDPAQVQKNISEYQGTSVVDEFGRQIITVERAPAAADPNQPMPSPGAAVAAGVDTPVPRPPTPVYQRGAPGLEPTGSPAPAAAPEAEAPRPPGPVYQEGTPEPRELELPRPFVLLPASYREFDGKAAYMQRSGRYTVLFHQSWVEPVDDEADSLPIVLDHSGDSGQWPRLQGSIKLFLSRYLHLQTDLWLNTDGAYLPGTWRMPAPPLGPPSLIIEEEEVIDLTAALTELPLATAADGTAEAADGTSGAPAGSGETAPGEAEAGAPGAEPVTADADAAADDIAAAMAAELEQAEAEALLKPVYPYRHAVLLQQTRRMRSGEVHYIDHPLFGIVIKITPVSAEELDRIANDPTLSLEPPQLPGSDTP